jgi:hypothetical protein
MQVPKSRKSSTEKQGKAAEKLKSRTPTTREKQEEVTG